MKKALLFGIIIMMCASLLAQKSTSAGGTDNAAPHETHVTPAQALNVGYAFMRTGDGTKSANVSKQAMQLVYTGQTHDSLTGTTIDCYYVFALQPKGFVIVAADDRVEPILGFSYDNDFAVAAMPDHVRAWLGGYERQIEAVTKSNLQTEPATQTKWTRLKNGQAMSSAKSSGTTVGPLLTTTWDQGQYYNSLCPADASGPAGHVYTGCVAIAMAQIIHYWGYPAHGRGTYSYESNYGTLTVNYANANYDHTLMPDALTSTSTQQEVDAVATLMRDCGVAVNMGYGPSESGSLDQDARAALINFFRYSPNLSFAEKTYFSESEWNAMLHADLDNNRPVYYSGQGSGGHAFVCDGYDADGYYHFNFGWGGFADGWFLTSSLTPGGSNFSSSQAALFGIVPDSTGNIILGQTQGTSTFTVDESLEFYHLMGHNAYEGGNYENSCNSTVNFVPANSTNQVVADILDFEDQTLTFSDGDGNPLRSLAGGNDNDYSPVVSSHNALNIAYSGNMYYAGFKVNISQSDNNGCRMVSNITTFVDTTTVHLTWTENGTATQWEIEYGVKGFPLGTGTIYTADTNMATFNNLQSLTEYDFYIRAICDSTHYGPWSKTTLMVEGPYWQDIVTSQPAGYAYNAQTNSVEITTAEQLAWWAKTGNGIDGHLAADIDLSGHRWQPTVLSDRNFNGNGHVIKNLYVIQGNGFFSECAEGCIIENVGLTNAYINNAESGGLCGTLRGTMRNCYVTNSVIQAKNDASIEKSYAGGLVCFNLGSIINCYVNADVISYYQGGLLACYSYGTIRNCYSTGTLPRLSWCYYGSIAAVFSGEIFHCYSDDACPANFISLSVGLTALTDVAFFENSGNGWSLLTPIVFEDVTENDLLSALNRGVEMYNDSAYCTWMADTGNRNGGFPVFGDHFVVQCPNVTDVSIHNIIVDNQYAVTIGWTENGNASQWLIRYRDHDRPDTAYSYVKATSNPDTLFGIPLGHEYDFNVRAICDTDHRNGWGETWSEIIDLPYWTDIVTTKPDGYVEDTDGNVEIYSTEGLVWLAVMMNGPYNQQYDAFAGKTVTLKSDIDLSGYRWNRIGHDNDWGQGAFCGIFDGQNHRISNIYMNSESGGLFGGLWNGGVVKNVILEGGSIICGRGYGGGLIGRAVHSTEISNCHVSTTVHSRYSVSTGALCGEIQSGNSNPTMVSNCSASGTVFGGSRCGNLIGHVLGNVVIRNCYATGDVYPANEISGEVYCRGVMIGTFEGNMINNCFSTGMVYNCPPAEMNVSNSECYGKVIGCLSLPNIHYLYGQNNVNAGLVEHGHYDIINNSLFTHSGNANTLLNPVSIEGTNYSDLLDALNAWVSLQNDTALRTWVLDTLTGYPVYGDYYAPFCYTPTNFTVSQATAVGSPTIKTRLAWAQKGEPDHWEVLYVASGESIGSGTIIPVNNNPCVMAGIPVGQSLDFYVRAVCGDADISTWCGPVTYLPDKLRWTEVVTSQPEGYQKHSDGNVYISSAEGLAWVSCVINRLNGNNSYYWFGDIILTEDIDMSAYRWTAIGNSWDHCCYHSFNGNNHVVSGLYCNELSAYQGFFGIMQRNIQNLTLSQCDIHGLYETGALAGHCNDVNIRNCLVNGRVSGPNSSMLIGASYNGTIENSCFISKDNKHGNPAATVGGSNNIVNFYVGDSDSSATSNRYYNSSTYYGDFSGDGYTWTLNSPLYINGAFRSALVDVLNTWVDANNTNGQYRRWVADTTMVNDGYPIFEFVSYPTVSTHDTVMSAGYYTWHGMVFTSDTVVNDTITTSIGYDSVVTHHIIVTPTMLTEITLDTCSSYMWNGETYAETGDYIQTLTASNGGDSVVVLRLTINPPTGNDEHVICDNSYSWIDGVTYVSDNNTATYTLQTTDGCDSVITLHLTFRQSTYSDTSAIACDSFDWYEHTSLTQSGDYTRTVSNASGCDSVVTLHLTINTPVAEFVEATVCDSYTWNDSVYTQSGDYTQTFTAANGCDSVVTLHLTVNHSNSGDTTAIVCGSFDWYEHTNLTQSGSYTHTFTTANGCDSVVTLHLTINPNPEVAITGNTTICPGSGTMLTATGADSYVWSNNSTNTFILVNMPNVYSVTGSTSAGCSNTATVTISVIQPPVITITGDLDLCAGNTGSITAHGGVSYLWSNGSTDSTLTVSNAGSWQVIGYGENGCNSMVSATVNVWQPTTTDFTVNTCDSYTWNNSVYTMSGDHTQNLQTIHGCDSVVTLHLTVNPSYHKELHISACDSYEWNGVTYSASGDYIQNFIAVNGCDSVVTLHLTVNTSYHSEQTAVACGQYVWRDSTYTTSGDYSITYTTESGCDSIFTLHLTINPIPEVVITGNTTICPGGSTTLTATGADSYMWSNYSTDASIPVNTFGVYSVMGATSAGCFNTTTVTVVVAQTPVITISGDLDLCAGNTGTITAHGGSTYLWNNGSTDSTLTLSGAGSWQVIGYDENGCSGTGSATVNVWQPKASNFTITACNSYTWNDSVYTQSGDYTQTFIAANGCDSIVTLHLTILPAPTVTISGNTNICESEPVTLTANVEANGFTPENLHYTWYESGQIRDNMTYGLGDHNEYIEYWYPRYEPYRFSVEVTYGADLPCVTLSGDYLVYVHPQVETPVVTVDHTSIYEGGEITLSITNPDLDPTTSYQWYRNGAVILGATQATIVDYPTTVGGETTDYVYTVEVSHFLSGCASAISAPTVVTVNATPVAIVTAANTVLCEGNSTTLHVNVTPTNNAYSYQWFEDGSLIPGATSADYVVTEPARDMAYNFAVAVSASGGLDILVSAPAITVVPAPIVVAFATGTTFCEGGSTTLYANVTPNQDATYIWYKNGVEMALYTPSITVTDGGAYTVEATVNGCSALAEPVTVTIEENPQLHLSATETDICVGGHTTITADVVNWIDGNIFYSWSDSYAHGSAYDFFPEQAGSHTITVTATNTASGCQGTNSITINVNNLPETPVVTVNQATVFDGDQVTLSVTNPIPNAIYTWYRNGQLIPYVNQTSFIDYPMTIDGEATVYTYAVVAALYNSGCVSAISDNTEVTVFPTPMANVTVSGSTIFCEGSSVTLHVDVTPYDGPSYSYQWYEDGVQIPGATSADYVVTGPARTTPYNYFVVVSANGSSNVTAYAPAVTVVSSPTVVATISENTVCAGGTATLTALVSGGVAGINGLNNYSFQWFRNANSTTELVGTDYSYTTTGDEPAGTYTYWVAISNGYGCNSQSESVMFTVENDPTVTITPAAGYNETVCDGGSAVLQANATGGFGELSYQWYKNGLVLIGETTQTLAINNLYFGVNDTYTVAVTQTGSGCAAISASQGVNVNALSYTTLHKISCEDYTWDGITYTQTGEYTQTFTGTNGCDSVVTLHLTINYSNTGDTSAVANDRFDWYEHTYLTMSGDYTHVFTNQSGCDSVVTLHLTVNDPTISVQDTVMTDGYFIWHGMVFTSDTVLTERIPVLNGYDSLVVYHIFVTPTPLTVLTVDTCDSYTLNGQTYTESGDYIQTFPISSGMDSVVVLYLTIFPADSTEFAETACEFFTWEGTTYTASGDYTQTFTNANGCDSVVTLHLTISPADSTEFSEIACESFTWNSETYTSSGDYTQTFTNASGCDSVVTLHLTVNHGTHNIESESTCDSYTWHGTEYTTSGTYTYEYTNANGCASVDTLMLTVNYSTHNVETETACESFMWHGTEYTTSGTYTYEYTNASGCTSVDTLMLTVNHGTHNVETETTCESFMWHEMEYTTSGIYTYEYINANGCTSVDTLHLSVNHAVSTEITVATEDSCYIWNDQTYCESGDYTQTLTAANGCDSVVTLHLTVSVGIDNYDGFDFKVYPNPTIGVVNVQFTNHNSPITQIHVFDAYGKLVDVVETRHGTSLQTLRIDLSGFASGVYYVKAVAGGKVVAVRKVVKR